MKHLRIPPLMATAAVALSLVLGGCGGGSDNDVMDPPPPPEPMPMAADGSVTLIKAQHDALKGVLKDNGDTAVLSIAANGTAMRAGVTFTCESDYPCTVTVTNNLGTIVATWESQILGDGTADAMASGLEPRVDTFARLNDGNTASIRAALNPTQSTATPARTAPDWTPTELIGMGIGGPGVTPEQAMPGLRSDFQANGADFGASPGDAAAAPGLTPTLTMGTTISGAMMPDGDGFSARVDGTRDDDEIASPPEGWAMKTLFRDWGDTAGDGDGGFETGAIVVKNLGEGTPYPFDRKLSAKYVNAAARAMFALTVLADGEAPTPAVVTTATSVDINPAGTGATPTQWAAMVFDSGSLVPAQDQDLLVDHDETFTGMYFGAPGKFQCVVDSSAATGCKLSRNADGTVGIFDSAAAEGIQGTGEWTFTPNDDAMITVPDQDWMAYGAWLTTPDAETGNHRLGVFFNGMDPYTPVTSALDATNAAGLRGSATYSGGATGAYVDGTKSGLFTARARLTADFDKATNGVDNDADYMISGRIDNFRGTDGEYLGSDTTADPNDPVDGGENDWVVVLGANDFGSATADGATDLAISSTATSGSADGVSWAGQWNGMFFGPADNADGDSIHPSGVAGRFWATTETLDSSNNLIGKLTTTGTSVVGAFGATKDD